MFLFHRVIYLINSRNTFSGKYRQSISLSPSSCISTGTQQISNLTGNKISWWFSRHIIQCPLFLCAIHCTRISLIFQIIAIGYCSVRPPGNISINGIIRNRRLFIDYITIANCSRFENSYESTNQPVHLSQIFGSLIKWKMCRSRKSAIGYRTLSLQYSSNSSYCRTFGFPARSSTFLLIGKSTTGNYYIFHRTSVNRMKQSPSLSLRIIFISHTGDSMSHSIKSSFKSGLSDRYPSIFRHIKIGS